MTQKAKVYVQGPAFGSITRRTFEDEGYQIVDTIKDSQICVWTGGEDIFPGLYGEKPLSGTYFSRHRDKVDLEAVKEAVEGGKFLVGICRGAQLLNVIPNGGKLWQDVDNHESCIHKAFDCLSGQWIKVNSVHHQALRITSEAEVICWALESTEKVAEGVTWGFSGRPIHEVPEAEKDIEAVWYSKTRSLLMQFHMEFGHPPTTEYAFKLIDKYYWGK